MKPSAWIFSVASASFGVGILAVLTLSGLAKQPNAAEDRVISLAEVAQHAQAQDCWLVIGAEVYDLSTYIPQHPTPPALIARWCGKEATQAYQTKDLGRPHSPYADSLLPQYRIGRLKP